MKKVYNSKYVSSLDVNVQNTFTEIWTTDLINPRSKIKKLCRVCFFVQFGW